MMIRTWSIPAVFSLVLVSGVSACSNSTDSNNGGAGGTGGSTSSTTSQTGGAGGGAPVPAAACESAGGICVSQGSCVSAGGTVASSSPGGCHFDDGPAECCVPASPKAAATTCADAGGLCAPIGGCLDAGGYTTSVSDGCNNGPAYTCCVPHTRCGDATIDCCTDTAIFNPACDDGKLVCTTGQSKPKGTCVVP